MKSDIEYLNHILLEIKFLEKESKKIQEKDFYKDEVLERAFIRSLEIIGEAVKKLSEDFRKKYILINWKVIAGTRDKLIHDYLGVDYELVWDIIKVKIPQLKKDLNKILTDINK